MPAHSRLMQVYLAASTVALVVLALAAFRRPSESLELDRLTVRRIDVVDSTGHVRLRIAGSFPPRRTDLAGILFTNDDGIEAGGLVYRGRKTNGRVSAAGTLTMDQYGEDQVVALQYSQDSAKRTSGLAINDRPDSLGPALRELYRVLDPMPESPRRDSIARAMLAQVPPDQRAARRVFLGRDSAKEAVLNLADRSGTPRMRLVVDSLGAARIEFLDIDGQVVRRIGPDSRVP